MNSKARIFRCKRHAERITERFSAPLAGRIFDALGEPMSPTASRGKLGKHYRYYVSASLQKGATGKAMRRSDAGVISRMSLPKSRCPGIQARLTGDELIEDDVTDAKALRLMAAVRIRNRRGCTEVPPVIIRTSRRDPVLAGALQRAHAMVDLDARHLPVCHRSPETQYGHRLIALAFLAPDLQQAILEGSQPADLTLEHLLAKAPRAPGVHSASCSITSDPPVRTPIAELNQAPERTIFLDRFLFRAIF